MLPFHFHTPCWNFKLSFKIIICNDSVLLGEVADWKLSIEIRGYAELASEVRGVGWKEFALSYADEIDPLLRV